MKKLASLFASIALASSAFAGPMTYSGKDKVPVTPPPPEDCFGPGFVLGVFAAGDLPRHRDYRDNGIGGGVLADYFFNAYIGIEASYNATGPEPVHHSYGGELILRCPIQSACVAPYVLVGGGGISNSENYGFWNAGVGIEFKIDHHTGIFADGTYNWAKEHDNDFTLVRVGLKYAF